MNQDSTIQWSGIGLAVPQQSCAAVFCGSNIVLFAAACASGYTCQPSAGTDTQYVCVAPAASSTTTSAASAPAPAMQPRIGSMGGPPMTPAATSKATPSATAASVFSTATTVPAITSVATLSAYATVAAFDTTEQTRVSSTIHLMFYQLFNAVCYLTSSTCNSTLNCFGSNISLRACVMAAVLQHS